MSKLVALWGSSGAYKTTTSVKLTHELCSKGKSVILVSADNCTPILPVLFQGKKEEKVSIGDVLSASEITQDLILSQCVSIPQHKKGAVIGYKSGDCANTFAPPNTEKVIDFFVQLKQLADVIIVDCTSDMLASAITTAALIQSDVTIQMTTADLAGLAFLQSQRQLLADSRFGLDRFCNVLCLASKDTLQAIPTAQAAQKAKIIIPYSPMVRRQAQAGELFDPLLDKHYNKALSLIVKEVI